MQYEKQYEEYYEVRPEKLTWDVEMVTFKRMPFSRVSFSDSIFVFGCVISINHTQ